MTTTLSQLTRQVMAGMYDYRASKNDARFQLAMARLQFIARMLGDFKELIDTDTCEEWW